MAAAICYGVRGGGAQLAFHITAGNYDTDTLIEVLGELRRFLGGEKATLLWDGLPAHRSRAMRAWIRTQRSWLVVERLPAYAPELNPVEGLWSSLKAVELANLTSPTLAEVIDQAHRGIDRVRGRRIWPTRSCAMPASRSHEPSTRHPSPFFRRRRPATTQAGSGRLPAECWATTPPRHPDLNEQPSRFAASLMGCSHCSTFVSLTAGWSLTARLERERRYPQNMEKGSSSTSLRRSSSRGVGSRWS